MTGILLSIVVVSTSAYISAQKIVKKVRHRQHAQPKQDNEEALQSPIPDEPSKTLPFVPATETSLPRILKIYQQIALQQGYYACVIDILNHTEGTNFIFWLEPKDLSSWQKLLNLQPIPDLVDPATSLNLYEQDLHTALTELESTDFTRITLLTMHYTLTNIVIKNTNQLQIKQQLNNPFNYKQELIPNPPQARQ